MAKLLLVDDDEHSMEWMAPALTNAGHSVRTAVGPRNAIDVVRAWHPDLVVTDILFPEMDGFSLARALQRNAPVAVMFVSIGRHEGEAVLRGAAAYVTKPITAHELRAAVDRVLGRDAANSTVLVVDDDPTVCDLYRMILEPRFRVVDAADGRDALSVLEHEVVALALVDVHMPVMNGVEFVRALRADARWKRLPVIVQTSDASSLRAPVWVDLHVEQVIGKQQFLQWLVAQVESRAVELHAAAH